MSIPKSFSRTSKNFIPSEVSHQSSPDGSNPLSRASSLSMLPPSSHSMPYLSASMRATVDLPTAGGPDITMERVN